MISMMFSSSFVIFILKRNQTKTRERERTRHSKCTTKIFTNKGAHYPKLNPTMNGFIDHKNNVKKINFLK